MDRNCTAVLAKINDLAPLGRYVIISDDEFYECLQGENKGEILSRALIDLQSGGFIDLRYSRQNMYCVAPLKKCEPEEPPEIVPQPQPEPAEKKRPSSPFLAAFCGGAAGSLLISLIFSLI